MADKNSTNSEKTKHKIRTIIRPPIQIYLVIGGMLLVCSAYLSFIRYQAIHGSADLPDPNQTISSDTETPEETKPNKSIIENYTVPANAPRTIRINNLGIHGLVQKVGITKANAIAAPTNIHFAGWYVNSVSPGQLGLSVIDGHVTGKYIDGIFKRLAEVTIGNNIEIEFGDGSTKQFVVVDTKKLPAIQSSSLLLTHNQDIKNQLNLITCSGKFDITTQTYSDRIIVISKLVKSW